MDESNTRYWLLFLIVITTGIALVVWFNKYSNNVCLPPPSSVGNSKNPIPTYKRNLQNKDISKTISTNQFYKTIVESIKDEPNQTRFKYEYRLWPQRDFLDPDNYSFYSIYGWPVNPPPQFPNNMMDTAYNEAMSKCVCAPSQGNEICLEKCRFNALKAAGFPSLS